MSDLVERLTAALADRYSIEREIGRGGMAVVYLAHDQKLNRQVALKVLRPELAASLGGERFLREIEIAAKLTHPNILGLYDCGEADGKLYYTMPFVEGESLRDRLNREKQLPVDDALQITKEVADALGHAHSLGIVHRDIKPENILFEAGHAVVSDFGIARAVSEAGAETLTETGLAVGTPAYMSPEQASGSKDIDARSDVYSLGCVLYEMLSGEPPYLGSTPLAIVAKKMSEAAPRVSVVRDKVPPAVEAAVDRALSRTPADRFATAEQFAVALTADLEALERPTSGSARLRLYAVGAVVLALVATAVWMLALRPSPSRVADLHAISLDSTAIAVLPFHVIAADSGSPVRAMAQSMGNMFDLWVTGEFGRRIGHPGSVIERWREAGGTPDTPLSEEAELLLGRELGMGALVRGTVLESDAGIVLAASLVDVATGAVRVPTERVEGPLDRGFELVGQLIVRLLSRDAGYSERTAPQLAQYQPEAVQALLAGHAAPFSSTLQRRYFRAALAADSSLVDAALYLYANGEMAHDSAELRYAWEHQEQLSERARAYLQALAAGRHGTIRTMAGAIASYEALTRRWPEWQHAWSVLGDKLANWGALASIPNWRTRAENALLRVDHPDRLDQVYLADMAFLDQDTARARELTDRILATDTAGWPGTKVPALAWRLEILRGDTAAARQALAGLPDSTWLWGYALSDGRGVADADRVVTALGGWHPWWWARGHDREWRDTWLRLASHGQANPIARDLFHPTGDAADVVYYGLLAGLTEDDMVTEVVRNFERVASGAGSATVTLDRQAWAACWSTLWRLWHGDAAGARETLRRMETLERPYRFVGWARLLEALLAEAEGGDVPAALLRMDSVVRELPLPHGFSEWSPFPIEVQNLLLAQRLSRYGYHERALTAIRRRPHQALVLSVYISLPEYLREEGRLAAIVGDTAGAIKAYRHYLALREDPDPPWRAQWDSVKSELGALAPR